MADTPSSDTPSTDTPSTDTPSTDTPSTDTWAEAAVARAMGADPGTAAAAVTAIDAAGLLEHGIAVVATAAASRWGVEPLDAIAQLAGGTPLRGALSDYELRVAREEAEDELGTGPVDPQAAEQPVEGLERRRAATSAHHLGVDCG